MRRFAGTLRSSDRSRMPIPLGNRPTRRARWPDSLFENYHSRYRWMAEELQQSSAGSKTAAQAAALAAAELQRQKRVERLTLVFALCFVVGIVALVALTDNPIAEGTTKVMHAMGLGGKGEPRNFVLDCRKPGNSRTPYCQERMGRAESTWKSITRFGDQPNAFSLHEK